MNEQLTFFLGDIWVDQVGNKLQYVYEFKTCCSPTMYHFKMLDSTSVYAYDSYGRRLSHLHTPVVGFDLIKKI